MKSLFFVAVLAMSVNAHAIVQEFCKSGVFSSTWIGATPLTPTKIADKTANPVSAFANFSALYPYSANTLYTNWSRDVYWPSFKRVEDNCRVFDFIRSRPNNVVNDYCFQTGDYNAYLRQTFTGFSQTHTQFGCNKSQFLGNAPISSGRVSGWKETSREKIEFDVSGVTTDANGALIRIPHYIKTMPFQVRKAGSASVTLHVSVQGKDGSWHSAPFSVGSSYAGSTTDELKVVGINESIYAIRIEGETDNNNAAILSSIQLSGADGSSYAK